MTISISRPAVTHTIPSAQLAELAATLERESGVIDTLRLALERQRAAVATSSADEVNGSVDDIGRILLTLDEARRHRSRLLETLAGGVAPALDDLAATLGVALPDDLERARQTLRVAAQAVAREVAINRTVLRGAVEAGETFLQELFSSAPSTSYSASERRDGPSAGVLLNRRA